MRARTNRTERKRVTFKENERDNKGCTKLPECFTFPSERRKHGRTPFSRRAGGGIAQHPTQSVSGGLAAGQHSLHKGEKVTNEWSVASQYAARALCDTLAYWVRMQGQASRWSGRGGVRSGAGPFEFLRVSLLPPVWLFAVGFFFGSFDFLDRPFCLLSFLSFLSLFFFSSFLHPSSSSSASFLVILIRFFLILLSVLFLT